MNVRHTSAWRRRWLVLVVLAAGLAAVDAGLGLWTSRSSAPVRTTPSREAVSDTVPPAGRPAPDFELPLFSGGTLTLHSLKGRPVVLNFWASWCVPCRTETPLLVRLYKTYGPRGIVFVGVDVEDEDRDARAFLGQYHVDYAVVRSSDERVMRAYRVMGIPTTVFIGADGVVAEKYTGAFLGPDGEKALVTRLERLLAGAKR